MSGKLFKQYKEDQGTGNSSIYKAYKGAMDSGLSTGNSTMDRYIEHKRQQEEEAKERKRLRDVRVNRETRERQVKNASLNKSRAAMTDFMRQEREKIQGDHTAEASQARLFSKSDTIKMKSLAETAKKKRDNERQNYLEKKANDAKGVAEYGPFRDGTVHITPYEDIKKRADFQTGAYQGAKDDRNPIGTGNTMKGFWSNAADGTMNPFLIAARAVKQSNGLYNHSFQSMTDDQKTMYNYLYHRYGSDQADRYASAIDDELNVKAGRQGAETVSKIGTVPAVGLNVLASTAAGSERAVKGLGQAVDMVTGNYETAPVSNFDGYLQHLQKKSSGAARIAYDLANSTGFMLPSMLVAPAAGVAMGASAGSVLGSAMFGAAAGGNSYADSIREGQDVERAQLYGALNAASETATQAFLGGLNNVSLGHPKVKSAIDTAVRKMVSNPAVRDRMIQAAGYGADMAAEGLQEYMQELLDKASRNKLFGEKNKISLADPEAWYAAMLGALNAGVLNAPGAIAQELDYRSEGKRNVPDYQDFVEGIDTDSTYAAFETQKEARDLQDLARRYAERQENGESISNRENGRFLERMAEFAGNVQQDKKISQNQEETVQNQEKNEQIPPESAQLVEDNIDLEDASPEQINPEEQVNTSEKPNTSSKTSQGDREFLDELSSKYGTSGMNAYLDNYDHTTDLNQYSRSFDRVYDAGRYGLRMEEGIHREALSTLGRDTLEKIWLAGAEDRNADISKVDEKTGEPLNMTKGEPRTGGLASAVENATPQQKAVATYMGERTGLQIELVDGMDHSGTTASYQKGKITLDVNSKDFLGGMGHELTHFIREMDPDNYRAYSETVAQAIVKSEGMDLEEGINSYIDRYLAQTGQELNRDQALEEMVADASQKFFNDEEFIKEVTANKALGQKILDFIDDVIDAIKSLIKTGSTRRSAKALEENMVYFQRARRAYMAGLEAASERYKAGYDVRSDSGERFKLIGKDENGIEIYETSEDTKNLSLAERKKKLKDMLLEEWRGRTAKFNIGEKTYYAQMDRQGAKKGIYGDKKSSKSGFESKINIGADKNYFELLENARYSGTSAEQGKKTSNGAHENVTNWDYFVKTIKADGQLYDVLINVRNKDNGNYVYDVTVKNKKAESPGNARSALYQGDSVPNTIQDSNSHVKTKFQLKDPVEETGTLIAAHNLTEDKLKKMLEYDGIPMPSIAITKADHGWNKFGDISLIFRKETIDPAGNRKNKVYGADAWTPTFPQIENDINEDVYYRASRNVDKTMTGKMPDYLKQEAKRFIQTQSGDAEHNGVDGVVEAAKNDIGMKAAYLASKGIQVEDRAKQVKKPNISLETENMYKSILNKIPDQDRVKKILNSGYSPKEILNAYGNELLNVYAQAKIENGMNPEQAYKQVQSAKEKAFRFGHVLDKFRNAFNYQEKGVQYTTEIERDEAGIREEIESQIDEKDYEDWIRDLYDGLVVGKGVPNGKEYLTPSGNSRTFKQLHYDVTPENIVKSMISQGKGDAKNVVGFMGIKTLRAAASGEFNSIADIHKAEGKIQNLTETEFAERQDALNNRLMNVIQNIIDRTGSTSYSAIDNVGSLIEEAAGMKNFSEKAVRKVFADIPYWKVSDEDFKEITNIVNEVKEMPVDMFEAKPQRVVGYDEVAVAVVPDGTNEKVMDALADRGIRTVTYDPDVEGARNKAVNSVENIRFQMEDIDEYTNEKDVKKLLKENEDLKEANELLKKEFTLTAKEELRQDDIKKVCRKILKEYNSKAKLDPLVSNVTKLFEYVRTGENVDWDEFNNVATDIGKSILNKAEQKDTALTEQYKDLRKQIKDTKIMITDQDKADLAATGGYNDFRRKYFGRMSLGKTGISVDSLYQELASQHPDLFDADITHPADQLMQIGNVLDMTQPQIANPYHANIDEMAYHVGQELLQEYQNIRLIPPTFADRKAAELNKVRRQYNEKLESYKQKTESQYSALLNEARRENADMQEAHARDLYWQKEKFNTKMKERREALAKREAKESVIKESTKLRKWLLEPNDKQHIPEELRTVVADFLSNIDFSSKTEYNGVKTQRTLAWEEALKAFNKIKESGQITDQDGNIRYVDVDPDLAKRIEELTEKTKGIDRLEELSAYDVEELLNTVRSMKSTITEINALKTNKKYGEVSLLAENVFEDTDMMKNRKEFLGPLSKVDSLLNVKMMDPVTVFHKMGPAMETVYDSITSGWDKKTKLLKEAEEYFKKSLEECGLKTKDIRAWTGKNPERHTFSLAGGDITLSTGQIMALYVLDKRSQARKHIYDRKGGIKAGDIDLGVSLKEKRLFPERQRGYKPIRVTADDVKTITDTLSADQKRLADKMQHFLGDNAAKWGNEASMQLYGYEKYKSKNYFPITTDKDYIMQPEGNKKESTIRNLGMTKSTNAYANNPIIVEDIFDVFTRHVDQMSSYNGLLVPLSDLHKLLNYKDARGLNDSSIQERIKATLGSNTAKYLDNLVDDINGSVHTRNDTGIADMLMGNMKAAAVAGNLRVAVQQPGSIARAYAELDAKYIARGLTKGANWDIITEYAPIAQWKDWGFYQMQVSRRMKDVLIDTDSAKDRFVNKTMFLAELGDQVTWKRLWNAVEYEIMDKHPDLQKGSEEYYTQVGRRFSEIIYKTQVADSVMLRTQIMRAQNGFDKMATAFMAEPLKTYNMLYRAVWDLKAGRMDKKTALKNAGRVAAAFTANAFLTAAAAAAIDMFRDDDKKKKLGEKYKSHLAANMIDNVNILNNIPYIRDVISTIQGDTVKRTDMQGVQDVYYAWQKVYKVMQNEGKYTPQYAFLEAVRSTSALTGLPIKSITKDALAIIDTAVSTLSDSAGYEATKTKYGLSLSENKSLYVNMMMNAEDAGDQKLADKIKKDLLDAGYTEEDIEEQVNREVNKEIKDEVDIITAADQYDYTDTESKKKFEDEIEKYVELKKRAGKTEKEALTAVKTKLTAHYKDLYQSGTAKEKNEIITRCNRFRYNGKAIYNGTEFKNWGKKKGSKS